MKIMVVSDLYPPYYVGGYEINCKDIVEALIGRGHQVTVLTSSWGLKRSLIQENVYRLLNYDHSSYDITFKMRSRYSAYFRKRILQIRRLFISSRNYSITKTVLSKLRPDLVYLWHFGSVTISPAICVQDMGIPMVFRVEDYSLAKMKDISNEKYSLLKRLYRNLIFQKKDINRLRTNNLLVISKAIKDYYIHSGFSEATMKIIPGGLPSHFLSDAARHPTHNSSVQGGSVHLVFVGRVDTTKGPDIAIEAFAKLKKIITTPMISLDIIGTGNPDYLEHLKLLAAHLDVSDQVSFLGKLDSGEVLRRFRHYDIFLFTSRWEEPFGRVILEAMSQGLPVIATRVGGIPEIINDKENGLLVPSDDPETLANAIKSLVVSPKLAEKIRLKAHETILARFTIEKVAAQTDAFLADMINSQ
jgi:glycogen(starch) synthase